MNPQFWLCTHIRLQKMFSWWVNTFANVCISITFNALFVLLIFQQTPPTKRIFSRSPPFLYVYYLLLVISVLFYYIYSSLFFKVFSTSTANMLFYQLRLMVLRLRLGCKKKLVVLRWANSNLDEAMLKIFWCQI